jgi:transposase
MPRRLPDPVEKRRGERGIISRHDGWGAIGDGERQVQREALLYEFSLERHVPERHLLRSIDRFVELHGLRRHLAPFYSTIGRPSIDPELMIRMLIVGHCFGIRSERRLCEGCT